MRYDLAWNEKATFRMQPTLCSSQFQCPICASKHSQIPLRVRACAHTPTHTHYVGTCKRALETDVLIIALFCIFDPAYIQRVWVQFMKLNTQALFMNYNSWTVQEHECIYLLITLIVTWTLHDKHSKIHVSNYQISICICQVPLLIQYSIYKKGRRRTKIVLLNIATGMYFLHNR